MNALIPLHEAVLNGEPQTTVDARELHAFLGSGRDFSSWIKDRIEKCGYAEGIDYSRLTKAIEREDQGLSRFIPGANRVDYTLSLDMAKELCMLERNEKGRQARQYFLAVEKHARVQHAALQHLQAELLKSHPVWAKIVRYSQANLNNREIAKLLDCNESTVRKHKLKMKHCGLLAAGTQLTVTGGDGSRPSAALTPSLEIGGAQ